MKIALAGLTIACSGKLFAAPDSSKSIRQCGPKKSFPYSRIAFLLLRSYRCVSTKLGEVDGRLEPLGYIIACWQHEFSSAARNMPENPDTHTPVLCEAETSVHELPSGTSCISCG